MSVQYSRAVQGDLSSTYQHVSGKSARGDLTRIESAFIRTRLVIIGDVCTAILIKIAGVGVIASIPRETGIAKETAGRSTGRIARDEVIWSAILAAGGVVTLLLCGNDDNEEGQEESF